MRRFKKRTPNPLKIPNLYAALSGDLSSLNSDKTNREDATGDFFEEVIPRPSKKQKPLKTQNRSV